MTAFSVIYRPTALFSLKDSNATNSGAKSLFFPSPYAIKMALLNQAITLDGVDFEGKNNQFFSFVRDAKISFNVSGRFCVNNCFIKILKKKGDKRSRKAKEEGEEFIPGFQNTISFREYIHLTGDLEIILESKELAGVKFLKKYLPKINYFGKKGCFYQFIQFKENPNPANVKILENGQLIPGVFQEYDDFSNSMIFDMVNSYSTKKVKRAKSIFIIPVEKINSSKSFSHYKTLSEV